MKNRLLILTALALTAFLSACMGSCLGGNPNESQWSATRELQAESDRQVGMPGVTNFTQKRHVRELYERLDQEGLETFTYVVDFEGRLWFVCDSIGYGVPFSAQFSNPETIIRVGMDQRWQMPQPEPNGLWPPTSSSATWVLCAAPDGDFRPFYIEPMIVVAPYELTAFGSWLEAE